MDYTEWRTVYLYALVVSQEGMATYEPDRDDAPWTRTRVMKVVVIFEVGGVFVITRRSGCASFCIQEHRIFHTSELETVSSGGLAWQAPISATRLALLLTVHINKRARLGAWPSG